MKKFILGAALMGVLSVGVQAFAFVPTLTNYAPSVEGHSTLNAEDGNGNAVIVIGGEIYPLTADNTVTQAWSIQQHIFDLQRQIASMPADDCAAK